MDDAVKELEVEVDEFSRSRSDFQQDFPYESALEYQHALNHLCIAVFKDKKWPGRLGNIQKAAGHIHRAHLDYLKIWLFKIHNPLKKASDPDFWVTTLGQCPLKLEELQSLGRAGRANIFKKYRVIMKPLLKLALPGLPLSAPIMPRYFSIISEIENVKEAYWEWAQLEAMVAAFSGFRLYNNITEVLRALERNDNTLEKTLITQSAFLYVGLLRSLSKMPNDNEGRANWLKKEIFGSSAWRGYCAIGAEIDGVNKTLETLKKGGSGSGLKRGLMSTLKQQDDLHIKLYDEAKKIIQRIKAEALFADDIKISDQPPAS